MPIPWDELKNTESGKVFTIANVPTYIAQYGDPWDGFYSKAVVIHSHRKWTEKKNQNPEGNKHKSPEQLDSYQQKRDFDKTIEPKGEEINEYTCLLYTSRCV